MAINRASKKKLKLYHVIYTMCKVDFNHIKEYLYEQKLDVFS